MRYSLIAACFFALVLMAVCSGCESTALKWEPVIKVVYMPKKFEDKRIMVNPWRDSKHVPYGPSYPYELVYNPSSGEYMVGLRENAPYEKGGQVSFRRNADPYTLIIPVRR